LLPKWFADRENESGRSARRRPARSRP